MKNRHILLAGMGRSGTTWLQQVINYQNDFNQSFEPFRSLQALDFEYIQYLAPDSTLNKQQSDILSDMVTINNASTNTLVKEIRCNMMLRWLQLHTPVTHLVYLVRNPLQVACSWQRLGWGKVPKQNKTDFQVISAQKKLLDDFPIIRSALKIVDTDSLFETYIFLWCAQNLVPSLQLKRQECKVIFYENLVLKPKQETQELFKFLNLTFDWSKIEESVSAPSAMTQRNGSQQIDSKERLFGWKKSLSREQIGRSEEIIEFFGLTDIYMLNGLPGPASFTRD